MDKVLSDSLKVESCAGCAFVFICALSSLLVAQGGTGGDIRSNHAGAPILKHADLHVAEATGRCTRFLIYYKVQMKHRGSD